MDSQVIAQLNLWKDRPVTGVKRQRITPCHKRKKCCDECKSLFKLLNTKCVLCGYRRSVYGNPYEKIPHQYALLCTFDFYFNARYNNAESEFMKCAESRFSKQIVHHIYGFIDRWDWYR